MIKMKIKDNVLFFIHNFIKKYYMHCKHIYKNFFLVKFANLLFCKPKKKF